ncbi:cell division protein FtsQ/DivIB [Candidatus Providencia siddallii]
MKDINCLIISKLLLTGNFHYTKNDDIKKIVLSLKHQKTFMNINLNNIKDKIVLIPWIKQTTVRKEWPNKLKINIIEYVPFAKWNNQNMIDENGQIFKIPNIKTNKENYVLLYGPIGTQKNVLLKYNFLSKIFLKHNLKLKSFTISSRYAWQIVLNNNIRIELGKNNLSERLNRFFEIYPLLQKIKDKQVDYIDLRYPNGVSVGWRFIWSESSSFNKNININFSWV